MAKYLVTGTAGFIGSNITDHLLNMGEKVIGIDNFSTGKKSNLDFINNHPKKENFSLLEADIRDLSSCKNACKNADYVIHLAALASVPGSMKEPLLFNETNITGTLNMLVAARDAKINRFVFSSSAAIYGDTEILPVSEEEKPNPKSPYAIAKITGEYYCEVFTKEYYLPTVILRYFNVFGPKQDPNSQYAAAIPKFITSAIDNKPITIFGDGEQTRDFIFIQDVIRANVLSCTADKDAWSTPINIGNNSEISINTLAKTIKELTNSNSSITHAPPRPEEVRNSLADITKARNLLGLEKLSSLKEGLKQAISWYQ